MEVTVKEESRDAPESSPQPRDGSSPETATAPSSPGWFRQVTWYSLLASLCPLLPVPFLDDWALGRVRRRAVESALRADLAQPAEWQVEILAGEERPLFHSGCLLATLVAVPFKLFVYVAKKIFRKLVIVFLVKDCVDKFSTLFHECYLLELARSRGLLTPEWLATRERLIALREAMDRTAREVDPRPVEQLVRRAFRGSRRLLWEGARGLARFLRRERRVGASSTAARESLAREQESLLGSLVDRLREELWNEHGYRTELDAAFERALAAVEPESGRPSARVDPS